MRQPRDVANPKALSATFSKRCRQDKPRRNPRQAGDAQPGKRCSQQEPRENCQRVATPYQ